MILPFQPTLGQAYILNINNIADTNEPYTAKISKNGGASVATTNSPTILPDSTGSNVFITLNLTAAEMSANIIWINLFDSTGANFLNLVIYTTGVAFGTTELFLNTVISDVQIVKSYNPTVQDILSVLWQAMTKTPKRKGLDYKTWFKEFNF